MYMINPDYESSDRIDLGRYMQYVESGDEGVYDSTDSRILVKLPTLPVQGEYVVTSEEHRPDLISYKLYQQVNYWWVILHYNGLRSPLDLVQGLKIKYPSIQSVEGLILNMKADARNTGENLEILPSTATINGRASVNNRTLGAYLPDADYRSNAYLLRAYAMYAANLYGLPFAVIEDFENANGVDESRTSHVDVLPYHVNFKSGSSTAKLMTISHKLLERTQGLAFHVAALPADHGLTFEISPDNGATWVRGFDGVAYLPKPTTEISVRFLYSQENPEKMTSDALIFGYVIVHD